MKKGQGLPLSTIVIAGLAVFVLITVAMIYGKGISIFGGGLHKQQTKVKLEEVKDLCMQYCNNMKDNFIRCLEDFGDKEQCMSQITGSLYCNAPIHLAGKEYRCYDIQPCSINYISATLVVRGLVDKDVCEGNKELEVTFLEFGIKKENIPQPTTEETQSVAEEGGQEQATQP